LAPVSAPHRPGQAPWPERQRPAPIQFHSEPPEPEQQPWVIWSLRGLGLLAVAVLSGFIWWYVHGESPPPSTATGTSTAPSSGQFAFTPAQEAPEPRHDSSCAEHAYGDIKTFFQTTRCDQLTRTLYTTTAPDGRKVYTNLSVVRMRTADDAAKLRALTDKDGTGNVNDLVREKIVKLPPVNSLSGGGGYKAVQQDRNVIIVESDFGPSVKRGDKNADETVLDAISEDVIRLANDGV
jgi:hypothetical protein